jgi:D-beta-D-heptose 7-phosphate kinase / D-beta-D-heptose 1-phosphate adenosyltransferase
MRTEAAIQLLSGFHAARVLVLGDVMLDRFVYGSVERISPEAPIPVINVQRVMDMAGGAGNVARNIAAMGARVVLLGVVGEDPGATELSVQLRASPSIDSHLIADGSRLTSIKTRYVAEGQQVMRADRESREPLGPAIESRVLDEFSGALADVQVIVLSDYAKGTLSDSVTRAAIDMARAAGKPVIVDPKSKSFGKYRGATMLTPNQLELQAASGRECHSDDAVAAAARELMGQGICDLMVVTRGGRGMSVIHQGAETHLPTSALQVFDVSGAGDTVVAAMSLGMAAGADPVDAAELANIAAGIVVGKRGTATVSTGEIVAALRPFESDPHKIFALDTALHLVRSWREQGLKVAFTNGCFDLLHPGHIALLQQARRSADRLVVGLNADLSIRRLKGVDRPVQSEVARATVLAAVKSVDAVVIFSEDTPIGLIEALEPDVLVKGADYTLDTVIGADLVTRRGGKVILAPLLEGHSTSNTVRRVARLAAS